jgi:hypothetical protein
MMKKGLIITGVFLAVLVGGGYAANQYVSNKIGDEVVKMTQDPAIQKAIDKAIAEGAADKVGQIQIPDDAGTAAGQTGSTGTGTASKGGNAASAPASSALKFNSREEAIAYAKSKFSTAEIASYTTKFLNKDSLSSAEKKQIKQDIMSRFTPQEMKALQEAVNK